MLTSDFWREALERSTKTAAQTAVAAIGTGALGLFDVHWTSVGAAAALGFALSLLTSLASAPFGEPDSPSLVTPHTDEWLDDDPTYLRNTGNTVTPGRDPIQDVTQDPATDYGD